MHKKYFRNFYLDNYLDLYKNLELFNEYFDEQLKHIYRRFDELIYFNNNQYEHNLAALIHGNTKLLGELHIVESCGFRKQRTVKLEACISRAGAACENRTHFGCAEVVVNAREPACVRFTCVGCSDRISRELKRYY
jgi:hypothetical protein